MNTLPDNVKALIYEYDNTYKDEFNNVLEQLLCGVCYCGWCGARQWTWTDCCCMNKREYRDVVWDCDAISQYPSLLSANTG